ncbi:hypothetical protein VTJ04DRAFT_5979 [Mycothermus thermophilus]|uniref:uncharacterized protein n=1 Tax=Humicola insolens TaxID=85995 RepID=UPI003741FC2A
MTWHGTNKREEKSTEFRAPLHCCSSSRAFSSTRERRPCTRRQLPVQCSRTQVPMPFQNAVGPIRNRSTRGWLPAVRFSFWNILTPPRAPLCPCHCNPWISLFPSLLGSA